MNKIQMKKNASTKNTLNLLKSIISKKRRFCNFLGYTFIIHRNVFPIDSSFSISSKMIAEAIPYNVDTVLDLGTGSGVQAIIAVKKGSGRVVALDIDENAVENAIKNIILHEMQDKVDVRKSDLLTNLDENESFDLIISNLPFSNQRLDDDISHLLFDPNLKLHERLLAQAKNHLTNSGHLLIATGDVGDEKRLKKLIDKYAYQLVKVKEAQCNKLIWKVYVLTTTGDVK